MATDVQRKIEYRKDLAGRLVGYMDFTAEAKRMFGDDIVLRAEISGWAPDEEIVDISEDTLADAKKWDQFDPITTAYGTEGDDTAMLELRSDMSLYVFLRNGRYFQVTPGGTRNASDPTSSEIGSWNYFPKAEA